MGVNDGDLQVVVYCVTEGLRRLLYWGLFVYFVIV